MGWKFWEKTPEPLVRNNEPSEEARRFSEEVLSKDEIEGYGSRAGGQRTMQALKAIGQGDMRKVMCNIDDLQGLDVRYAKEFEQASIHMEKRAEKENTVLHKAVSLVYEDLSNDKRYQYWKEEQERVEKRLNVHWVDKVLDRPNETLTWALRVWTVVGVAMGVGRTAYLWRTIDKRYAKLHGVSLLSIAMFEVSLHTMKGAGAAVVGSFGAAVGDATPHLVHAAWYRDPVFRSREALHVTTAGAAFGFFSSATFAITNYKYFGKKGIATVSLAGMTIFGLFGYYVGNYIYHPFVSKLEHRYDDPYWRPWQNRNLQRDGSGRFTKGRYL